MPFLDPGSAGKRKATIMSDAIGPHQREHHEGTG
jgi:hypothetical protein